MACGGCDSKGYRWVWPRSGEEKINSVVFRCDCSIGRAKFSTGIPLWSSSLEKKFTSKAPVIEETVPDAQESPVSASSPSVRPKVPSADEKAFLREIRLTKDWSHPRLKDLIGIYGSETVKAAMMGRV